MSLDLDDIRALLRAELEARSRIDAHAHADHHAYIADLIERAKRRREMWDRVRQQVVGWAVIGALGAAGTWAAREFSRLFHDRLGG